MASLSDGAKRSRYNATMAMTKRQLFNTSSALRYSDLFGNKIPLQSVKKVLRRFNLSSVVIALSQINTLIAIAKLNNEGFSNLSDYLVDNYFDEEIRNNPKFIESRRAGHSIFGRQQLLTQIRLCFLECSDDGALLADDHTPGGYELGRCYLMLSDHYFTKRWMKPFRAAQRRRGVETWPCNLLPSLNLTFRKS